VKYEHVRISDDMNFVKPFSQTQKFESIWKKVYRLSEIDKNSKGTVLPFFMRISTRNR
jgi:hypothetical protein